MTDRMDALRARLRVGAGAAVVLVLVGLGCAVLASALVPHGDTVSVPSPDDTAVRDAARGIVHVLGGVERPGVYEFAPGERVVDVIARAGGLTDDADPAGVNLARPLVDGEQLLVPRVGEGPEAAAPGDGLVNLNTADEAALDTLPRVGPALAGRIIAWREANGGFRSVDDLLSVAGVGDATLAGLRDLVTV